MTKINTIAPEPDATDTTWVCGHWLGVGISNSNVWQRLITTVDLPGMCCSVKYGG